MKYPRSLPKTPEARAWWEGAYKFFKENGTKAGYPPFELPSGEKVEIHYSQNKDSVNTDRNTGLKTRPKSQSSKDAAIRNAGLKQQEQAYIDTWLEGGYSQEQAEEALKRHKKNHRGLANQVRDLNQEYGSHSFSLGHGTAVKEGGGDFIGNERLEIGKSKDGKRGNFSRAADDELTDSVKPLIGQPRSGRGGRDSALMDILELENPGIMDTGLNPLDRQRITANPELANDIMAERQAAMKLNPKAKGPNRLSKGLVRTAKGVTRLIPTPIDDLIVGTAVAGITGAATLLTGGGTAQAADNTKNTFLDIATGDLDGGNILPGTVEEFGGGDNRTAIELERARNSEMPNLLNPPGLVDEKRNQERLELEERARQARERGGRVTIGAGKASFTLPEFGLSELFGFN